MGVLTTFQSKRARQPMMMVMIMPERFINGVRGWGWVLNGIGSSCSPASLDQIAPPQASNENHNFDETTFMLGPIVSLIYKNYKNKFYAGDNFWDARLALFDGARVWFFPV